MRSIGLSLIFLLGMSCENGITQNSVGVPQGEIEKHDSNVTNKHLQKSNNVWIPSEYLGLRLGKSTLEDVKKKLGAPRYEGPNVEKAYNDAEDEILLQYHGVEFQDAVDFVIGKKTKIVKAIAIYPEIRLTKQEIIQKYGTDFFEISSHESMCLDEKQLNEEKTQNSEYPIILVYPTKGKYVLFKEDERVNHIGYGMKCFDK